MEFLHEVMQMGAPAAAAIAAIAAGIMVPLSIKIVTKANYKDEQFMALERRVSLSENAQMRLERNNEC